MERWARLQEWRDGHDRTDRHFRRHARGAERGPIPRAAGLPSFGTQSSAETSRRAAGLAGETVEHVACCTTTPYTSRGERNEARSPTCNGGHCARAAGPGRRGHVAGLILLPARHGLAVPKRGRGDGGDTVPILDCAWRSSGRGRAFDDYDRPLPEYTAWTGRLYRIQRGGYCAGCSPERITSASASTRLRRPRERQPPRRWASPLTVLWTGVSSPNARLLLKMRWCETKRTRRGFLRKYIASRDGPSDGHFPRRLGSRGWRLSGAKGLMDDYQADAGAGARGTRRGAARRQRETFADVRERDGAGGVAWSVC